MSVCRMLAFISLPLLRTFDLPTHCIEREDLNPFKEYTPYIDTNIQTYKHTNMQTYCCAGAFPSPATPTHRNRITRGVHDTTIFGTRTIGNMRVQPARPNAMAFGTRLSNDSLTGDQSDHLLLAVLLSSVASTSGPWIPIYGVLATILYNRVLEGLVRLKFDALVGLELRDSGGTPTEGC